MLKRTGTKQRSDDSERNRKKQEDSFTGSLEINLGNPPKVPFQ